MIRKSKRHSRIRITENIIYYLHDLPVKKSITLSQVLRHKVSMASMKPLMPPFLCCFGGPICIVSKAISKHGAQIEEKYART